MDDIPNSTTQANKPLEYEETPVIEPVAEPPAPETITSMAPPEPAPEIPATPVQTQPKKGISFLGLLGNIILLVILFGAGVGLSMFLRQYLPSGIPKPPSLPIPTPALSVSAGPAQPADPYALWKTYQVISGVTRSAIVGISFKLPSDVPAPICDGGSCASQGTYLPGGTRLTVAPRGVGQLLPDYRGKTVSDLSGQAFTVKEASVAGKPAIEFSGLFTGATNGGYAFNQMHGFMIEVTDTLSLEVNHFTPNGVTADFASDDTLFTKIVGSLDFSGLAATGSAASPVTSPTLAPVLSPTATATPPSVNPY